MKVYYKPGSVWGATKKEEKHYVYIPPSSKNWSVKSPVRTKKCKVLTNDEIAVFMKEVSFYGR